MVVTLGMAAAAGAVGVYNWAANLYSYNRDAWMTDIQVEQEHAYQEDNLKIAMHSMDREEVRDLMQNCINKINNVILVTALILSLAGEMLFEGQIPADCAPFVLNAYMLCLGSAIFHLVLSILFGLCASSEATETSTVLLTRTIKPKWGDNFNKMRQRKRVELTRAFEEKPMSVLLKPPLAGRMIKRFVHASRRRSRDDGTHSDDEPADAEGARRDSRTCAASEDPDQSEVSPADAARRISETRPSQWHRRWEVHERKWFRLTQCMFRCVTFGTKNLLEACSYLCIATLYGQYDDAWVFWAVQIIFTSLHVLIWVFFIREEKSKGFPNIPERVKHRCNPLLLACIPSASAIGPLLCALAATVPMKVFDGIFIPLGYSSHVVTTFSIFAIYLYHWFYRGTEDEMMETTYDCESQAPSVMFPSEPREDPLLKSDAGALYSQLVDSGDSNPSAETLLYKSAPVPGHVNWEAADVEKALEEAEQRSKRCSSKKRSSTAEPSPKTLSPDAARTLPNDMLCCGLLILLILWISALVWATVGAVNRSIRDRTSWPEWMTDIGGQETPTLKVEAFNFRHPSPYFHPHAVTCPRKGEFFLADKFRVFSLPEGEDGMNAEPKPYECDVNGGIIKDIAAICDDAEGRCWPVVLTDTNPPQVIDCRTNNISKLLQANIQPERLAANGLDSRATDRLYASEGGQVVQYRRSAKGYEPEWIVKNGKADILALDVVGNFLVVFRGHGLVEYQDLATGHHCGVWRIQAQEVIGGGCARGRSIHILATTGQTVQIYKVQLPEVSSCKQEKDPHPRRVQQVRQHRSNSTSL